MHNLKGKKHHATYLDKKITKPFEKKITQPPRTKNHTTSLDKIIPQLLGTKKFPQLLGMKKIMPNLRTKKSCNLSQIFLGHFEFVTAYIGLVYIVYFISGVAKIIIVSIPH